MSDSYQPGRAIVSRELAQRAADFAEDLGFPLVVDKRIPDGTAVLASFEQGLRPRSCLDRYLDELIVRELRRPNPRAICIITGI